MNSVEVVDISTDFDLTKKQRYMCGITGLVQIGQKRLHLPEVLNKMTNALSHRGPDDEGYVFFKTENEVEAHGKDTPSDIKIKIPANVADISHEYSIGLGHRRLSVIDVTSAGHQPMKTEDRKLWMVFNGEIYNYLELKEELESFGYIFSSHSDTEVLLVAYKHWGFEMTNHLNGMWAFVIYDREKKILFGARDRFGVKPFYYHLGKDYFAFASQQKALLQVPVLERRINPKALSDYLVNGHTESEAHGLFDTILELMPSHALSFDLNTSKLKIWKYYHLAFEKEWEDFNAVKAEDIIQNTRHLLEKAVKMRLRSDVPVGSCLSGGIDSSSIVCLIDDLLKKEGAAQVGAVQKVFTATFKGEKIDESKWAEKVVKATKTEWHTTTPTGKDLLNDFEDIVFAQDIPFFSSSTYAQYRVMKLISESGVKVTLDGQGADELFSGYNKHFNVYMAEMLKNGKFSDFIDAYQNAGDSFANQKRILPELAKIMAFDKLPEFIRKKIYLRSNPEFTYLNSEFLNNCDFALDGGLPSNLNEYLNRQFNGSDLKVLMRTADRNSKRFSVESRVPFADDINLIEYVSRIPASYKIHNNESKFLLRNAMNGLVPNEVLARKDKLGFATPEISWLKEIKNDLRAYMTPDLKEYLDVDGLLNNWDRLFENAEHHGSSRLWRIINFAIWKRVFDL